MCDQPDTVDGVKSGADMEQVPVKDLKGHCDETEKDSEEVIPDVPNAPII
jgi:hypothetical protein